MSDARPSQLKPRSMPSIDGGIADNENKIIIPQNTTANLAEITPQAASIAYDTDQQKVVFNDGTGFQPIAGSVTGVIDITHGGTGETTANDALNALLPDQSASSGQFLQTDGTDVSWQVVSAGANESLSNLTSPTAINQDLILDTGSNATIKTKDNSGPQSRDLTITTGVGTGVRSGILTVESGDSDTRPGNLSVSAGNMTGAGGFGGGSVSISGGNINGSGTGSGGAVSFNTGSSQTGNPGSFVVVTGSNNSSVRGDIRFQNGSEGTPSQVWTSTDASGSGAWASASAPSGTPNSSTYFNGAGALSSNSGAYFDQNLNARADVVNAGGSLSITGEGGWAHGLIGPGGSFNVVGRGSLIQGEVGNSGSSMSTPGAGGIVAGFAAGGGAMAAGVGGIAHGSTQNGGSFINVNTGSEGSGLVSTGGSIQAAGNASKAMGVAASLNIIAQGDASFAAGAPSAGDISVTGTAAVGYGDQITNSANLGWALGLGQDNSSYASMVIGRYGSNSGTASSWVSTEPVWVIGNGTGTGSRANALQVDKDGRIAETGANRVPVRILTGSDTLSARSDRKLILSSTGSLTLTLPAGEEGLCYQFGLASGSTGVWTLAPNGADTVDATIATINSANGIVFHSGKWYQCY